MNKQNKDYEKAWLIIIIIVIKIIIEKRRENNTWINWWNCKLQSRKQGLEKNRRIMLMSRQERRRPKLHILYNITWYVSMNQPPFIFLSKTYLYTMKIQGVRLGFGFLKYSKN